MRVLVLEREKAFRDRVRGEGMHPWGTAEARALGIADHLMAAGGHAVRWFQYYAEGTPAARRDLVATSPGNDPALDFYHPAMQQAMLDLAETSGAEVRRGAQVTALATGPSPEVRVESDRGHERVRARLVVGADGRSSHVRSMAGVPVCKAPDCLVIAGVLHANLGVAEDAVHVVPNTARGEGVLIFPLGGNRFRSYFVYRRQGAPRPLGGARHAADFVAACAGAGAPAEWFARAEVVGPLAAFEGADRWVERPYGDGVALIGDAAAASDPCFGAGLALTLRDVRVLRDHLLGSSDWDAAARAYAAEHLGYRGALRRIQGWMRELFYERGPEADRRRAHALPVLAADPARRPDHLALGPDAPSDECARRRFFGEDAAAA